MRFFTATALSMLLWFTFLSPAAAQMPSNTRDLDANAYKGASSQIQEFGRRVFNTRNAPRSPIEIVASIIQIALGLLGLITVVIIIFAGYKWITSGGNPEAVKTAKSQITNAVIGLLIITLAYSIVAFVINSLVTATQ